MGYAIILLIILYSHLDLLRKVEINSQSEVQENQKVKAVIIHCYKLC